MTYEPRRPFDFPSGVPPLTKREYFASKVLSLLCSHYLEEGYEFPLVASKVASASLMIAEALTAALAQDQNEN